MCGILAYFIASGETRDRGPVLKALDMVRHRGPDGHGLIIGRGPHILGMHSEEAFSWALGHTRLAILDLTDAGVQPLSYANARLWITYNGEVYNYLEIREELEKKGYRFDTRTDTEVILAAYLEWGSGCVTRFIGMFAFVLIDLERQSVFVARDRLGVKPLYLWTDGIRTAVVSELKQLTAFPSFTRTCNRQQIADYLVDGVLGHEPTECCFEGVHPLPPGHTMNWGLEHVPQISHARRYWEPSTTSRTLAWPDAVEQTGFLFKDAVRLRFRADVPVGSCLSGGVDSSCIVGVATHVLGHPLQTFSSCFTDPLIDEQEYMDSVIAHCRCKASKVFPTEDELLKDLDSLVYTQDEPFGSFSIYAQWRVMKEARKAGIPVLLDGQGGDETLCGYKKYAYFLMRQYLSDHSYGDFVSHFLQLIRNGDRRLLDWKTGQRYLPQLFRKNIDNMSALLTPEWTTVIRHVWHDKMSGVDRLHSFQRADLGYWSLPALLRYEDRNSMAFGVESRLPFLDHRFIEHCLTLPEAFFFRNGRTKRVLVDAVAECLPVKVRERITKVGFETPQDAWLRGRLGDVIMERLAESPSLGMFFHRNAVLTAIRDYRAGKRDYTHLAIFRIASLTLWADKFDVRV
jgi:asparagine synthase (glutamine-hydrolysing)